MKAPISNADFGKTADDYLTHRVGFPNSMYAHIEAQTGALKDRDCVDLGTGTGTLARGLAALGNRVTGVDPAPDMLAAARTLGPPEITYVEGSAETTGLAGNSYDLVAAGQCWHWFNVAQACQEIRRLLRPHGSILIAYYDWLPLPGNMVRRTEELIEAFNPQWRGGNGRGMHPSCLTDLAIAGFNDIRSFSYDEPATYSHEGWRGRIRASAGVAATLDKATVIEFDRQLATMLGTDYPTDPMVVPHRVFVVTARIED